MLRIGCVHAQTCRGKVHVCSAECVQLPGYVAQCCSVTYFASRFQNILDTHERSYSHAPLKSLAQESFDHKNRRLALTIFFTLFLFQKKKDYEILWLPMIPTYFKPYFFRFNAVIFRIKKTINSKINNYIVCMLISAPLLSVKVAEVY